jgi:hypothetical protein
MRWSWWSWGLLAVVACSDPESEVDAGGTADIGLNPDLGLVTDSGTRPDTGVVTDGGVPDLGGTDAEPTDADPGDTLAADALPDGGPADSGEVTDSGALDTGTTTFGCGLPPPPYTAGEQSCVGCPSANPPPPNFVLQAGAVTRTTLNGVVSGAVGDGQFFVVGTTTSAGQLFGAVPVDAAGSYTVTVPLFCGVQYVVLVFCNASGTDVLTYQVTTDNCTEPDLRATIVWDALGDDWELHVIKPGGRINDNATDCTWTSCIPTGPDWGVIGDVTDNPAKDVDDVDGYGPENIILGRPEDGTFTVMVEHWGPGDPGSDGYVILNVRGQTYVLDLIDFPPRFVRTAFTVSFPSGAVATSTVNYDCNGNWSGGCRDPIP